MRKSRSIYVLLPILMLICGCTLEPDINGNTLVTVKNQTDVDLVFQYKKMIGEQSIPMNETVKHQSSNLCQMVDGITVLNNKERFPFYPQCTETECHITIDSVSIRLR